MMKQFRVPFSSGVVLCGMALVTVLPSTYAQEPTGGGSVFERPATQAQYVNQSRALHAALEEEDFTLADRLLGDLVRLAPKDPVLRYLRARVQAGRGEWDAALASLDDAVNFGFRGAEALTKDPLFEPVREKIDFLRIVEAARPSPGNESAVSRGSGIRLPVREGVARIREINTEWDYRVGAFRTRFSWPDSMSQPVVAVGEDRWRKLLREGWKAGTIAGHGGDLYDNRDAGHSQLRHGLFPQLARIDYPREKLNRNFRTGLPLHFVHGATVLGNCSMAMTEGANWRSLPRLAYVTKGGAQRLHALYRSNHIYCFPEHQDHDPGHSGRNGGGYGDVFPANTPYVVLSQGSSGSDRPFLRAIAATLAAFPPDTKEKLRDLGLVAPTVQWILRRTWAGALEEEAYLDGSAHPTVFTANQLDIAAMVREATDLTPATIPPLARIRMLQEEGSPLGGTRIFDTPQAIARVFRSVKRETSYIVSAAESLDPGKGRPRYHWVVLRGREDAIRIRPLKEDGSIVEIRVPWHQRSPVVPGSPLESNRVDIGLFVENEHHFSAPAFLSVNFLDYETRAYDREGRLLFLDTTTPEKRDNYVDPMLEKLPPRRDEFQYDRSGALIGWVRRQGDEVIKFDARGQRVGE